MKLLIITQKIDINDDLLGFMHGWIKEFAKHCQQVTVVCLERGKSELPENIKILSLGKEEKRSRLQYIIRFYKYIWKERGNYNKVLVHMNKEYVLLGGIFWKLSGKKIGLWYNHLKGNIFSRLSGYLAGIIFFTSPYSFFSQNKKAKIMPAGINTDNFYRNDNIKKIKNSLLYVGRISPVKNVDVLIRAANILDKKGIDFVLNIVGEPGERDKNYFKEIKRLAKELEKKEKINFSGKLPNYKTPEIYNSNEIFINLTNSGSFDKTILEAMACESLALVSNESFIKIFPGQWHKLMIFKEKDEHDLADKITNLLSLNNKSTIGKESRGIVIKHHSLDILIKRIISLFNNEK